MTEALDLTTLAPERPTARIRTEGDPDGTLYGLLVPEELGAVDLARISRLFSDHDKLWEDEERDKAGDKLLTKLLDELAQTLIPDAPAEAIAALPALTKRSLAVRFFVQAGLAATPALADVESRLANSSPA